MCFESNERPAELVEVGGDLNILQPGLNRIFLGLLVGFTWIILSDFKHPACASVQVSAAESTSGWVMRLDGSFLPISFVSINRSHFHYSFLSPLIQPLGSTLAVADTEEWAASKKLPPCKDVFLSENKRCCQKTSPPDIVAVVVLTGSCRVKEAVGCSVRPFLPTPVQHRLQWVSLILEFCYGVKGR